MIWSADNYIYAVIHSKHIVICAKKAIQHRKKLNNIKAGTAWKKSYRMEKSGTAWQKAEQPKKPTAWKNHIE